MNSLDDLIAYQTKFSDLLPVKLEYPVQKLNDLNMGPVSSITDDHWNSFRVSAVDNCCSVI